MAMLVEGASDARFLTSIVQRTGEQLVLQHGRTVTDVLAPLIVRRQPGEDLAASVLRAARQASGYHCLIVHADADRRDPAQAHVKRMQPGIAQVIAARAKEPGLCDQIVPLIPVHMTEAWMLADAEALCAIIGTVMGAADIGLPLQPHEVEGIADPKRVLHQAIQRALAGRPRRRRQIERAEIDEPLARQISLAKLARVPAYQQFTDDLRHALRTVHILNEVP